jgi:hypothetical protein
MKFWNVFVLGIFALLAVELWLATRESEVPPPAPPQREAEVSEPPAALADNVPPVPVPQISPAAPSPRTEESRYANRRDLTDPLVASYPPSMPPPRRASVDNPEVAADFEEVALMLRNYRALTGENPVGTNAEIVKALNGDNPKGAHLGPPDGEGLNENGELIDRWGTPYFFHALTKDLMEIHSAGPDRRMWNEDDLVSD